jgi:hypothetical protein
MGKTIHNLLTVAVLGASVGHLGAQQPPKPKPDSVRPGMAGMQMGDSARMLGMADHAMSGMGAADTNMAKHMRMTPRRTATHADSVRAAQIVKDLRVALARYRDPAAAVADGYKQFLPNVKNQKVYHFTNYRLAFMEAFRFDPAKPTSLLYQPQPDGKLKLIGAMYTAPKRYSYDQLDARVPLGIAQWHQHVNWCLPPKGKQDRWLDRADGAPVFGPESAVATEGACDKVGGEFHAVLFNWMVHANVFLGDDPRVIWGDAM